MKELVKYIRGQVDLSQEQFALAMGTTSITVNRWENGKSVPNKMAQNTLFKFCSENQIDLAAHIVESIKLHQKGNGILYHGSRKGIIGEIAPISRNKCDFGAGFYTGTEPLQPLTLVCDEEKPMFYTMRLNTKDIKIFHVQTELEWALLIAYYRGYMDGVKESPIYEKYAHFTEGYDVVVGYIANDRMYQTLTDFFNRTITDRVMIESLSALGLGTQYVALTKRGCQAFEILEERTLRPLELMAVREKSQMNRRTGLALADEMREKYRREGKFFDEMLKGV